MGELLKCISGLLAKGSENERDENVPFFVERELLSSDVVVSVEDIGVLNCPASEQEVKKLIDISTKSRFGLRNQTLLDENIRDSYEIKAHKLQVTLNDNFSKMLSEMGKILGLPESTELKPYLHNMLIYGPSQFFSKHQDTEKLNGMVATLVIVLPSPHIGGDLIVEHKDEKHIFSSENINSTANKCLVFYADCKHEIRKIKQGYRIALTYNLVLPPGQVPSAKVNLKLKTAINAYLKKKAKSRDTDSTRSYLVYFLNYSYTEHSLRWDMLKGMDRKNAFEMFNIAKESALIPNLALVDIHECYTGPDDDPRLGRYNTFDDSWDEEMSDDSFNNDSSELEDKETTLSYWIGPSNEVLLLNKVDISDDDVCWTKDTKQFAPDSKESTGYTGNEGCTTDYWYRRAAVVLVQAFLGNKFLVNFSHNYHVAIKEFFELVKQPSKENQALQIIEKVGSYLYRNHFGTDENDLKTFAELALSIKSRNIAQKLLSYFDWKILDSNIIEILIKLQNKYDPAFLRTLLTSWRDHGNINELKDYYATVDCLVSNGIDATVIQKMIEIEKVAIIEKFPKSSKFFIFPEKKIKTINRLKQMLQTCLLVPSETLQIEIVNFIIKDENVEFISLHNLVSLFFDLRKNPLSYQAPYYKPMKDYLVAKCTEQRAVHYRSEDDWSISAKFPCDCDHCEIAKRFLESKTKVKIVWPFVQDHHRHVYHTLLGLKQPLSMSIDGAGYFHKQIIVKNEKLHKNSKAEFEKFTSYLTDLQKEQC